MTSTIDSSPLATGEIKWRETTFKNIMLKDIRHKTYTQRIVIYKCKYKIIIASDTLLSVYCSKNCSK